MKDRLAIFVLVAATILAVTISGQAQKGGEIKPPPDTSTLAESQKWFADSFPKYASYKTRANTVAVTNAKFDGCHFSYTQVRKSGSVSTAVMGATRTINSVKDDLSYDLSRLAPDGIAISDHIYPEIQTLELRFIDDARIVEIVLKREASEAFKSTLNQIRRLCTAKN